MVFRILLKWTFFKLLFFKFIYILFTIFCLIDCIKKMETKIVFWAMKKIKLLQAHLLFHSRNISGSQVEHSAAACFFKNILWPWENEISPFGQSLVDDDRVVVQITVNYSAIIHAHLHHVPGAASPQVTPCRRAPPLRSGPPVTEPVRQWGNVAPSGTEGDGLLVSRAWRSRVLGMEPGRNKVVPSKQRNRMTRLLRRFL